VNWIDRVVSRRYLLSFQSSSTKREGTGAGGGCQKVREAMKRDYYSLESRSYNPAKDLLNPKLEKPLGLLDMDYNKKNKGDCKKDSDFKELLNETVFTKRHSVENYMFDPFVFCSAFNEKN
jgi:hypothetical protein